MHRGSWLLIAALVVAGGCARGRGAVDDGAGVWPAHSVIRLNVTNQYTLPVDIYAVAAGASYRMGTVSPGIASEFVLRQAMIGNGPVEFLARPVNGDPPIRSGQLLLGPGDVVDFEIAVHPVNSTARVRP